MGDKLRLMLETSARLLRLSLLQARRTGRARNWPDG